MNGLKNIFLVRHASSLRNECVVEAGDMPDFDVQISKNGMCQADAAGPDGRMRDMNYIFAGFAQNTR
ncbi:MAG: hypothetical protein LBD94_03000 [Rickettsiales bacterium]|nr:hypothetical protein [Rickettsiales bacterium]